MPANINRFNKNGLFSRHSAAATIAAQVNAVFQRQGWIAPWSDHGSVTEIAKRWSARTLLVTLREELEINLATQQTLLRDRAEALRNFLTQGSLDPANTGPSSDASQAVVELKEQRHVRREELRVLRRQASDQRELLEGLEHRLHSARDILRLKVEGIGRIDYIECPTCHRSIDPSTFALTAQSAASVKAHIEALSRDRTLIISNIRSSEAQVVRVAAELADVEDRLRDAERALVTVIGAVGAVREQLAKAAADLSSVEREGDKVATLGQELRDLQIAIDTWIEQTQAVGISPAHQLDLVRRISEFTNRLRTFLRALGHSAILAQPTADVSLDDRYVPYLGPRRLRSLGSASDHPRLVSAYALALAAASESTNGLHPGFVVLDEPLQQNPDAKHRKLFIDFLTSEVARSLRFQTIVFTWLEDHELERLTDAKVPITNPINEHFLRLIPPPLPRSDTEEHVEDASDEGEPAASE